MMESSNESIIEGKNAVIEALRSQRPVDRILVLEHFGEGSMGTVIREAKKRNVLIKYVSREILDRISETGKHQGVIAYVSAYEFSTVKNILARAEEKNEPPFVIILDGIEDPHNLGAIIRTANAAGAHGIIISKHHSAGLTATVVKASAGAINYTPVARVTNITKTMESLKDKGMWFVCADMDGESIYSLDLTGSIGLVIGSEGRGVGRLVKENCDFVAAIPINGEINSLNASVACGVAAYEIVRQRLNHK